MLPNFFAISLLQDSGRVWCGCWWPRLCVTLYRPTALLSPNMGPGAMWHQPIRSSHGDKSANQRLESAAHYHATLFIGPAPPGINWYFLAPLNGVKTNKPTHINSSCPWHFVSSPGHIETESHHKEWRREKLSSARRVAMSLGFWQGYSHLKRKKSSPGISPTLSSRAAALFELPISTRQLFTLISRCKDSQKYWVSFWPDLVRICSCASFSPSPLFAVNVI